MSCHSTLTSMDEDWDSFLDEININLPTSIPSTIVDVSPIELEKKCQSNVILDPTVCSTCNTPGHISGGVVYCLQCGARRPYMQNVQNYSHLTNYVAGDSHMTFRFLGKHVYRNNRTLMRTCSVYTVYSKAADQRGLIEENFQFEGKKIPRDAICLAVDLFTRVKEAGHVFRGNGKKGIIAACVFYACVIKGITKRPSDIAEIFGVGERFLSQGDRKLQALKEQGVIDIPTFLRPLPDYIKQYFSALHIPEKYGSFIIDLIDRAEKKHIHIMNESRMTTKCVGAILMLTMRVPKLRRITKDTIRIECGISKSTFTRYYNLLCQHHRRIRKVFVKHRIPMPDGWAKSPEYIEDRRTARTAGRFTLT